jgi:hypothetical protein
MFAPIALVARLKMLSFSSPGAEGEQTLAMLVGIKQRNA